MTSRYKVQATIITMIDKNRYPRIQRSSRLRSSANISQPDELPSAVKVPEFAHGTYGALLFDERWKTRRAAILLRDQYGCVICRSGSELQVHHRQYHFVKSANKFKPPWDYADHLLITLCKSCHNRGHSKFKVPTLSV